MSNRLSILRGQGWSRLGLLGAAVMLPVTVMQHSLGLFSEGLRGLEQAAEYYVCGAAVALIIGFAVPWVIHGFVVRSRDGDEGEEEHKPQKRPAGGAAAGRPGTRPKG